MDLFQLQVGGPCHLLRKYYHENMKININNKQIISNTDVRWYLSSQIIWIGKEKNYDEIEKLKNKSYGSFEWLWSDSDTILFNKEDLNFIGAVIKLNEPIIVKMGKMDKVLLEEREGNIKISEERNFECNLSDFTEYYIEEDNLLSYSEKWDRANLSIEVKITSDFSVLLQNNEMVGILIYNASNHLIPDVVYQVDANENIDSNLCIKLGRFFELIEKIDNDDLTQHEELELKKAFLEIYEEVLPYNELSYVALKDTIVNVVDYL
ncbi:hypothetical protein PVA17_16680 [Lysinibacillus sp. CNPSo 3705]|uniref:hypothetical protein n=1 Tax=Lysinibacillus sp. CNPSo 3705 TaxID=3028148 RepID=UPI0023641015|nr:hypothetical protein [Lysinibacillus sp. CNPSo 3705]MDD1504378.1 hypothetical protein [Lysinibacillus sp. CNPSo 3705]